MTPPGTRKVQVLLGMKPIWDRLWLKTFTRWMDWLTITSIMLPSGQVEVHSIILCRMNPSRSAKIHTIAVGMHQVEGQKQFLSPSDESILLEMG